MKTPSSSSPRHYSRFIPSEEIGDVTEWKFGAVNGFDEAEPEPEPEPPDPAIAQAAEAERQELVRHTWDDAFAQGAEQGRTEATAEWQHRMDDYVAGQGRAAAQRMDSLFATLEAALGDIQQRMAQDTLQLACDIARQVLRQELASNPNALLPVVREAVGLVLAENKPASVRAHPEDLETLGPALADEFSRADVQWVPDANVEAGGCLVEAGGLVVDGTMPSRWQRAMAALGLHAPWDDTPAQTEAPAEDRHAD